MVLVGPPKSEKSVMTKSSSRSGGRQSGGKDGAAKAARNNRACQLNPNNDAYWKSRGLKEKPGDSGDGRPPKTGRR